MSLSVDGIWKAGVWAETVWADGVWFEGTASAVITGTASDGMTEAEVVGGTANLLLETGGNLLKEDGGLLLIGGETIIITLTNDTWVAAGATFDAARAAILAGLDSNLSETFGWNNEVRDKEVVGAVIRTSDTVVTITLSAAPDYDITEDEVITVTIPASALTGSELTATPTFTVTADVSASRPGGGWAMLSYYDRYYEERKERERQRKTALEATRSLDKTDREIAKLLHKQLEYEARSEEIAKLEQIIKTGYTQQQSIKAMRYNEKVSRAYERAIEKGTFSAVEAFEREMDRLREEEELLLMLLVME